MKDAKKFVGHIFKIEEIKNYNYISVLLEKEDLILTYCTLQNFSVGDKVELKIRNGLEIYKCRLLEASQNVDKYVDKKATIEGANEKELITYLKTVSYMNLIIDKVKSDPDKIDSNTLYEVFFAKDKIAGILKEGVADKLVKQEAEDMLVLLNGIISLLGEDRIKRIYTQHEKSRSIAKEDKVKYATERGFNGKLERRLIKIKSQLIKLVFKLVIYKIPYIIFSVILFNAKMWLPILAEKLYGPLIFDEARDITGELINSLGPNVMYCADILYCAGALALGFIFMQWMLNICYIGITMSYRATGNTDGFLESISKLINHKTIELCNEYIKVIEVVEEYTVEDRLERNKNMLAEMQEDTEILPGELKIDLINEIRQLIENEKYSERFKGQVLIEKTYDKYLKIKNQFVGCDNVDETAKKKCSKKKGSILIE